MKRFANLGGVWLLCQAVAAVAQTNTASVLELHVKDVVYLRFTQSPVVILEDKDEKRFLPIWIGLGEAQAIAIELQEIRPPRPMTHDLIPTLVKELEGKIDHVTLTESKANTYYANLALVSHGKTKLIDCRPSDGIAIALRVKAPILASESVMQNALPVPSEASAEEAGAQKVQTLGLTVQTLTPDLAEAFALGKTAGVLVAACEQRSIRRGDVIVAVGKTEVKDVAEFNAALEKADKEGAIELRVWRNGESLSVSLRSSVPSGR